MQRNFEPMRKQVETWQRSELTDVTSKVVIYKAFVEDKLEAPKHLARTVHDLLARHAIGDWGELEPSDVAENENGVAHGFRLLSSCQTDGE